MHCLLVFIQISNLILLLSAFSICNVSWSYLLLAIITCYGTWCFANYLPGKYCSKQDQSISVSLELIVGQTTCYSAWCFAYYFVEKYHFSHSAQDRSLYVSVELIVGRSRSWRCFPTVTTKRTKTSWGSAEPNSGKMFNSILWGCLHFLGHLDFWDFHHH